jgi:hypothetical protein
MNAPLALELIEDQPTPAPARALATTPTPADLLAIAVNQGADLDKLERLMALQERWEANEARRAYNEAMAAFKAEAIEIIKRKEVDFTTKSGNRTSYKHAELSDVIEAVGPALSRHGFSWSWTPSQKQGWIEVTCTLKHRMGHFETATLGGPADDSGGKNAIQAVISTTTYLERHTLKAICGVSEKGEDNDGAGAAARVDEWQQRVTEAATEDSLAKVKKDGATAFSKAKDVPGFAEFMKAVAHRSRELKGAANA